LIIDELVDVYGLLADNACTFYNIVLSKLTA